MPGTHFFGANTGTWPNLAGWDSAMMCLVKAVPIDEYHH